MQADAKLNSYVKGWWLPVTGGAVSWRANPFGASRSMTSSGLVLMRRLATIRGQSRAGSMDIL
jgi:hypothetical protein